MATDLHVFSVGENHSGQKCLCALVSVAHSLSQSTVRGHTGSDGLPKTTRSRSHKDAAKTTVTAMVGF